MTDIFPISLSVALILIFFDKFLTKSGIRNLRSSPQTLHKKSVSRFGGLALFISLFVISFSSQDAEYEFLRQVLLCTSPVFIVGLVDDMQISISPLTRLLVLIPSAFLCYYFLGTKAENLEIPFIDYLFQFEVFSIIFICFALAGIINAFNILDGMNGLLLLFCLSICLSIIIFPQSSVSLEFYFYLVAIFFSILGIFVLNFPWGRIFLGDGGAYFLGATVTVGLIKYYQINDLSPWYVFLMLIYPIADVFFSIFRRIISNYSALEPDNKHLHHLIYKRLKKINIQSEKLRHVLVTFSTFIIYFPFLLGANYFSSDTLVLQLLSLIFFIFYLFLYLILAPRDFFYRS